MTLPVPPARGRAGPGAMLDAGMHASAHAPAVPGPGQPPRQGPSSLVCFRAHVATLSAPLVGALVGALRQQGLHGMCISCFSSVRCF